MKRENTGPGHSALFMTKDDKQDLKNEPLPVKRLIFFNSGGECKTGNSSKLKVPFVLEEPSTQKSIEQTNSQKHCLLVKVLLIGLLLI